MRSVSVESYKLRTLNKPRSGRFYAKWGLRVPWHSGQDLEMTLFCRSGLRVGALLAIPYSTSLGVKIKLLFLSHIWYCDMAPSCVNWEEGACTGPASAMLCVLWPFGCVINRSSLLMFSSIWSHTAEDLSSFARHSDDVVTRSPPCTSVRRRSSHNQFLLFPAFPPFRNCTRTEFNPLGCVGMDFSSAIRQHVCCSKLLLSLFLLFVRTTSGQPIRISSH